MPAGDSIQGFNKKAMREIQAALDKLPKEFSITRRRTILKKGLDPFINAAISKAPQDTGDLKLSIGTKTFRNNKNSVFGGVITKKKIKIGGSVGSESLDAFYAKFIEFGFTHVAWPEKGKRIDKGDYSRSRLKKVEAKPFLRPAWEETKQRVKAETIGISEKRIKAYMRKVNKN